MNRYFYVFVLFPFLVFAQPKDALLKGRVLDAAGKPIEFAAVGIVETNQAMYTNAEGNYSLRIKAGYSSVTLQINYVGKLSVTKKLTPADYNKSQNITLQDQSLTLDNVVVSAQRKVSVNSNSSIVFDRQAIEQVQAYSLADVLNNLPGKSTVPPDLQYRQNITLRTAASADPTQQAINSMGVAIYVDGIRQSNDANMQNTNIGIGGVRSALVINHRDTGPGNSSYDTPFSGLDIRNIPVDNIENIEVISGVASAKYGELTDGAVIVNRKAGKTNYNAAVRLNGSSTNASISKGYQLSPKAGALNVNFNFLNSVQDPANSVKSYSRVTGGTMWTTNFGTQIKNTFSADFAFKIDNVRLDPDDLDKERMYTKERRLSLANRTTFTIDNGWINRANLNLSYDFGYNETMRQVWVNKAPIAVADKDTTGIYVGYYSAGNFYSTDHIIGKPYNVSGSFDLTSTARTGKINHALSYGTSVYASGNTGRGVIADPTLPFTNNGTTSYKNERPYDFDLLRPIINFGFYAEDRFAFNLFKRELTISAGIRYDVQNSSPSYQPRINASYKLNNHWAVRGAFGTATKAPPMSYRYPGPTYFDIPLINAYDADPAKRLYLVYTQKFIPDNSNLKPSKSTQIELGVSADYETIKTSLYGYYKRNSDGFNSGASFLPIYLPVYTFLPGQTPAYAPTGTTRLYAGLSVNQVGNNVNSSNYGVEWFVNTRKFMAIQTSFTFNTSLAYSRFNNSGYTIKAAADSYIQSGATAWYGIYPGTNFKNLSVTSKLSSDTHVPRLGFVVSLLMDIYWTNYQKYLGLSTLPVAYIDKNANTVPIENFDSTNKDYGYLLLQPDALSNVSDPPFVYTSLSLRISKEIKKKIRVALYAYNFLDIKTQYYNPVTNDLKIYSNPVNVGAEVSFKF